MLVGPRAAAQRAHAVPDLGHMRPCAHLSYETPYLGPEGGRPGKPTQAVRHTCSGKLGIVKILRYIRSEMYTASSTN
jgi:hypothetical protein